MKVKSTIELNYSAGRQGIKKGIIELFLTTNKNTESKIISVSISDSVIITTPDPMSPGGKQYITNSSESFTYAEYDAILDNIQAVKKYEQTGTELEDMLLHDYLLQKANTEKWYGSTTSGWSKI